MKKFFKKWSPSREKLKNTWGFRWFGKHLLHPTMWAFNRRSVVLALTIGVACAFVPVPFQMLLAAGFAVWLHANVPVAVLGVWISNPITMVPMFYGTYRVGVWLCKVFGAVPQTVMDAKQLGHMIGCIMPPFHCQLDIRFADIIGPMSLGLFVCGVVAATATYFITDYLWCLHTKRQWQRRNRGKTA